MGGGSVVMDVVCCVLICDGKEEDFYKPPFRMKCATMVFRYPPLAAQTHSSNVNGVASCCNNFCSARYAKVREDATSTTIETAAEISLELGFKKSNRETSS